PYKDVQNNSSYVLEDMNDGKKYSRRRYCSDDRIIVDDKHHYLKFTNVKPGLIYQIRYCLGGKGEGHVVYDNLSFVLLMGD
ncbi:MAG: hypothetical protein II077_07700, partial [Treponema sp.]|nr:hypothetical protein [Treponema sp.]